MEGDVFRSFVPVPNVTGAVPTRQAIADDNAKKHGTREEIHRAVVELSASTGLFSAAAVAALVGSVGERTVRRHLADMVRTGELAVEGNGRSTRYRSVE